MEEERALLPFESVALGIAFEPDFGRAASLHDEVDFLEEMLLRVERAAPRHLDEIAAPFGFRAVKLDIGALAAQALPRHEGQVLHLADADIAETGNALGLHELVIGGLHPAPFAVAGPLSAGRLVPMNLARYIMHCCLFLFPGLGRVGARIAIDFPASTRRPRPAKPRLTKGQFALVSANVRHPPHQFQNPRPRELRCGH